MGMSNMRGGGAGAELPRPPGRWSTRDPPAASATSSGGRGRLPGGCTTRWLARGGGRGRGGTGEQTLLGGGRRVRPDAVAARLGADMESTGSRGGPPMGDDERAVRAERPGGQQTPDPRASPPASPPASPTGPFWFGVELDPDGDQVLVPDRRGHRRPDAGRDARRARPPFGRRPHRLDHPAPAPWSPASTASRSGSLRPVTRGSNGCSINPELSE